MAILEALEVMGGSGPMGQVLDLVGEKMKSQLNGFDRQPLPSTPKHPRWRNTAQWTRNDMVKEGLLSSASPFGIWEITPAGRRWLAQAKQAGTGHTVVGEGGAKR